MSAFSTTFSAFCAGNVALPQLLAVLRDDLLRDRQALFDDTALIEWAWRSGRMDHEVYQALRDTITGLDLSAPQSGPWDDQSWPVIRASHDDWSSDPQDSTATDEGETLFRSSIRSLPLDSRTRHSAPWPSAPSNRPWTDSPLSSDQPAQDVRPGTVLKERFVLEEILGRGGMGTVYRARDIRKEEAQDRHPYVAVKVVNEDFRRHPESFKALQREAKKSQSLAHPNVASVFDFDRDGSIVFLVMELLEGESLQQMIQDMSGHKLPRAEVLRIVRSAGAALAYAHQKGVVHSDFKPANAIRTRDGTIKVLDFGIARAISRPSDLTAETTRFNVSGLRALTPAYASCEMLIGEQAHPSDDVFALACVTYELFSGRHPFGHLSALLAERRGLKPTPIDGLDRRTWRALAAGLAFSRAERTASIETFLAELAPKRRTGVLSFATAAVAAAAAAAWFYAPPLQNLDPRTLWPRVTAAETQPAAPAPAASVEHVSPEPIATAPIDNNYGKQLSEAIQSRTIASTDPVTPTPLAVEEAPVQATVHTVSTPEKEAAPPEVRPSQPPTPRQFSVEQLKRRLIALAQAHEVPDALAALNDLKARLGAEDEFVRFDGPRAIGQMYVGLCDKNLLDGNYSAALALLDRAQEQAPDLPDIPVRRERVQRVADLAEILASGSIPSGAEIEQRLIEIRESEGPDYYPIRSRLGQVLARRIEALQASAPAEANQLLMLGQDVFPGVSAIEALSPVDEGAANEEQGAARHVLTSSS